MVDEEQLEMVHSEENGLKPRSSDQEVVSAHFAKCAEPLSLHVELSGFPLPGGGSSGAT